MRELLNAYAWICSASKLTYRMCVCVRRMAFMHCVHMLQLLFFNIARNLIIYVFILYMCMCIVSNNVCIVYTTRCIELIYICASMNIAYDDTAACNVTYKEHYVATTNWACPCRHINYFKIIKIN